MMSVSTPETAGSGVAPTPGACSQNAACQPLFFGRRQRISK